MKFAKIILPLFLLCFVSCYEDYVHDYEEPNMAFAVDKPLRTIIAEREMSIFVGVAIGGKREVNMDDWAKFTIDASLVNGTGKVLLPDNYYRLSDPEYFRVRKSSLPVADVRIDFTDEFYNDPLCLENHYVLPFRMIENSLNAIREGAEASLVVIKYVSAYSGAYYRIGQVTEVDALGMTVADPENYGDNQDINKSNTTNFISRMPRVVVCPGVGKDSESVGSLVLSLDSENGVTVTGIADKALITSASGKYRIEGDYYFVANADKRAPQFDLEYIYEKEGKYFKVVEKLVLRQDPLYDLIVERW